MRINFISLTVLISIAIYGNVAFCRDSPEQHNNHEQHHHNNPSWNSANTWKQGNSGSWHNNSNEHDEHHEHHEHDEHHGQTVIYYPYYPTVLYYDYYYVSPPSNNYYSPNENYSNYTTVAPQDYPDGTWVDANNGSVPENAIAISNNNGNRQYYCRTTYNGAVYYGILNENDACYVNDTDNAVSIRFNTYQVLTQ